MLVNPERGYFSKFYSACPYRLFFFFLPKNTFLFQITFLGGGFLIESGKVDTKHDWIRLCVNLAARSISRDLAERLLSKTPQKSFQNDEGRLEEMGGGVSLLFWKSRPTAGQQLAEKKAVKMAGGSGFNGLLPWQLPALAGSLLIFPPVRFPALVPFNPLMEGSWHQVTLSAVQRANFLFFFFFFFLLFCFS